MTRPTELHDEALLTPEQVTAWFAERGMVISIKRVREQLESGAIPGYKVGGRWITPLPWLQRWLHGPGDDVASVHPANATVIPFLARRQSA